MADFELGELLHKSLAEIRALSSAEVVEWFAFFAYRKAQAEVERG